MKILITGACGHIGSYLSENVCQKMPRFCQENERFSLRLGKKLETKLLVFGKVCERIYPVR